MQKITAKRRVIIIQAAMTTERNSMDLNMAIAPTFSTEHGLSVVLMVVLAENSPEILNHT